MGFGSLGQGCAAPVISHRTGKQEALTCQLQPFYLSPGQPSREGREGGLGQSGLEEDFTADAHDLLSREAWGIGLKPLPWQVVGRLRSLVLKAAPERCMSHLRGSCGSQSLRSLEEVARLEFAEADSDSESALSVVVRMPGDLKAWPKTCRQVVEASSNPGL